MSNFGSFSYFQIFLSLGVQQGLQKLPKLDINDIGLLFHRYILIPRKCLRKPPFKTQGGGGQNCRFWDWMAPKLKLLYCDWLKEMSKLHFFQPLTSQKKHSTWFWHSLSNFKTKWEIQISWPSLGSNMDPLEAVSYLDKLSFWVLHNTNLWNWFYLE